MISDTVGAVLISQHGSIYTTWLVGKATLDPEAKTDEVERPVIVFAGVDDPTDISKDADRSLLGYHQSRNVAGCDLASIELAVEMRVRDGEPLLVPIERFLSQPFENRQPRVFEGVPRGTPGGDRTLFASRRRRKARSSSGDRDDFRRCR